MDRLIRTLFLCSDLVEARKQGTQKDDELTKLQEEITSLKDAKEEPRGRVELV